MGYTDMWEIIDDTGTIHSGTEEEMRTAYDIMKLDIDSMIQQKKCNKKIIKLHAEYYTAWDGDLKLIQIHDITR